MGRPVKTPLYSGLYFAREAAEFTQAECAASVGVTCQAWSNLETGDTQPSLALALRIAAFFRCGVEELWALEEEVGA